MLAVSNLAWPPDNEGEAFDRLARLGVQGVEVAPTRLAAWDALSPALLASYRARLATSGLVVSSLQAILFGRTDLTLLGENSSFGGMREHIQRVSDVAAMLGARVLVFGSPRNRLRLGMDPDKAWDLARERLRVLGDIVVAADAVIGVEPVPAFYGGDFLTSWADVLRMVREVDHPGVRVHLDTGCVALGGDQIEVAIDASHPWLAHFHAAQPELGSFSAPAANHAAAGQALYKAGYGHWIAIEMREQPSNPLGALEEAVRAVQSAYNRVLRS